MQGKHLLCWRKRDNPTRTPSPPHSAPSDVQAIHGGGDPGPPGRAQPRRHAADTQVGAWCSLQGCCSLNTCVLGAVGALECSQGGFSHPPCLSAASQQLWQARLVQLPALPRCCCHCAALACTDTAHAPPLLLAVYRTRMLILDEVDQLLAPQVGNAMALLQYRS